MQNNLQRIKRLEKKQDFLIKEKATTAYNIITNKKKSPDIDLITKLKNLYTKEYVKDKPLKERLRDDLSLIRLSIEDYENICKDEEIFNTVIKILNIDEQKKLKKICEKIHIFTEHIDLSPSKIKDKMKAKMTPIKDLDPDLFSDMKAGPMKLFDLPEHIIEHITHHSLKSLYKNKYKMPKYKLVDGIPEDKLNVDYLSKNPNAIYYLLDKGLPIDYYWLTGNTNPIAMRLLEDEIYNDNSKIYIDWHELSKNPSPEAIKILKDNRDIIKWDILSENTNPNAIKLIEKEIKKNPKNISIIRLSTNETPEAINLLEKIIFNPNPIYVIEWYHIWKNLSKNSKAVKILKDNRKNINWDSLSANKSTEAIELLEEELKVNPRHINWSALSGNPNQKAFELLQANPHNIDWDALSENTNPNAIDLLYRKMIVEHKLTESQYNDLKRLSKIRWDKISKNPNAIKLLKERIIYEDNLPEDRRGRLQYSEIICWNALSLNPSIFTIEK